MTIIAIFAGLAETLATVALVKLPPEIQSTFVYFVMAFPAGIVLLFFWVLYFKNTVLYAPSDFENQSHYLEVNEVKQNINSQLDKVFSRLNKGGERLSKDEIEKAKGSIEKALDTFSSLDPIGKGIFSFIRAQPATFDEIRNKFDISTSTVHKYLSNMEGKGIIIEEDKFWYVNV